MALTSAGRNAAVGGLTAQATHIGLVNASGTALSGARQPVAWAAANTGRQNLAGDETFAIAAGETVGGWRGYTALTGGADLGGADLLPNETYTGAGQYVLEAASTYYEASA